MLAAVIDGDKEMRKIFAVSAVALLAFAGQAVASEGVSTLAPALGQIGYADGDAGGGMMTADFGLDALGALLLIGGTVALLSSGDRHEDNGQSA
jgi:hypothetical protein